MRQWGLIGLLKVIRSLDSRWSGCWSYLANRFIIPDAVYPAKDLAKCSTNGEIEESLIVMALRGWRSCMSQSDFPSCLRTQNQCEW